MQIALRGCLGGMTCHLLDLEDVRAVRGASQRTTIDLVPRPTSV
jgi:hypothetical protein